MIESPYELAAAALSGGLAASAVGGLWLLRLHRRFEARVLGLVVRAEIKAERGVNEALCRVADVGAAARIRGLDAERRLDAVEARVSGVIEDQAAYQFAAATDRDALHQLAGRLGLVEHEAAVHGRMIESYIEAASCLYPESEVTW